MSTDRMQRSNEALEIAIAWARAVVGHFGNASLETPSVLFQQLADQAPLAAALRLEGATPQELHAAAAAAVAVGDSRFARLVRERSGSPAECFLLALVIAIELDHLVTCAIGELQAPERRSLCSVHLAAVLLHEYFGVASIAELLRLAIVRNRVVEVGGDGPIPLREFTIAPGLLAVTTGVVPTWPSTTTLVDDDASLLPQQVGGLLPAIAEALQKGLVRGLVVRGWPQSGRRCVAAAVAKRLSLVAVECDAALWRDDAAFEHACCAARWLPVLRPTLAPGETLRLGLAARTWPVCVVLGSDGAVEDAEVATVAIPSPDLEERRSWWAQRIGDSALAGELASNAAVSGFVIHRTARAARWIAERNGAPLDASHVALARAAGGGDALRLLAQPVSTSVPKSAIVLEETVQSDLDEFVQRCRRRESLWHGLGETMARTPNHGARALFVGASGTGKTLAASYVATSLGAPLYRVDVAAVMNKYIGESEKNLGRILDLAAAADVVLLFDEADAMFGARSDGSDVGERYANMLTNFLLTRIETHPGIVVLTTNSRLRIDAAFSRRLDTIIEFAMPGPGERLRLWQSHLGTRSPGDDVCRWIAAHCDLSGGAVRNAVLAAAAAIGDGDGGHAGVIPRRGLIRAIAREYRKMGRSMPAALAAAKE